MNLYYHSTSATGRPGLMFRGAPGREAEFQGPGEQVLTRAEERGPTGKFAAAGFHPVVRVIAACVFVIALFALIGGAIELAL